jgi:hypothetical protein
MRRCASQPLVRRAAPTPSSSPRTKSVRASSGTGASDGELLGLADPVPVGVPLGVAVELSVAVELVGTAPSGGDTAGVNVVEPAAGPAGPEEPVAADAPVSAAASAARTAASSSCAAIAFAAASICCWGVRVAADGVGVGMLDGAVDDGPVTEENGCASEARGAGVPSAGAVVRVPGVVVGVAVSEVLGVPAATDGAVVDATGLGVVGVVGVVDRVTGGAARSLEGADGVGVWLGVLVAVVGTDAGVGLGVLGIALARSLVTVLAVARGTVLGVGLGVVRVKLRSSSPGVLLLVLVLVLVLGDVLLVGVASAGVVAPLGDGVGTDDPVARAAAAARNALTTSAVICSRARWSCAFSSGETKGLLDAAPAPGFGVGVIVTVYPSGTGVGVRAPAPGVGESVPSAPWSPLASVELVGVGLGVIVPTVGSTGTAAPPAPSWPMPGMPIVKAPAAGGVDQMGGFPASEACVPMAAAAAGVATAAGPNASSRTARDRLRGLSGSCFMATPVGIVHKGTQAVRHDTQVHSGHGCGDQEARLYGYDRPRRRVAR